MDIDTLDIDTLATRAGRVTDPTPDALDAGRHRLDQAIDAAGARVVAVRRSRRPRRWGIAALVGTAAAAAAVITVPMVVATPASAHEVLLAAADGAGRQVDDAAGAAYWHVVSEVDYPDTEPFRRDIWKGRSGDSILRDEVSAAEQAGTGPLDPALVRTESLGGPATFVVGGHVLSWQDLEQLPTDADDLAAHLREMVRGHASGAENALWEGITGLLRESPASPALRRALWEVAATMPDVELVGTMTDAVGRAGTAVERDQLDDGWYRVVYILDPADGTLLESRDIDADGNVVYRQTELERGPSDTAPVAQPPICGPGSVPETSC